MDRTLQVKEDKLKDLLSKIGTCMVALSGGVDSAYLAVTAHDALGVNALAVTAESPSFPANQKEIVSAIVSRYGLRHEFIQSDELEDPNYAGNPVNRCYFCKHELYSKLAAIAVARGFACVLDGNNLDDTGDYRPGRQAAEELSVRSPLIEAGLSKSDIRALSRARRLPTWNLPASACLASRIPYGSPVTEEKLRMIEAGEAALRSMGFRQCRVRHHGDIARIEIDRAEIGRALRLDVLDLVAAQFKAIGFRFVTLDVEGYRSGRLNESIVTPDGFEVSDT